MNCKEFSNLLDAWMDGALPDGEADRMQAHAAECGDCASLLALRKDCRRLDEEIMQLQDMIDQAKNLPGVVTY